MVEKAVTPALPAGELIALRLHLSVPIEDEANQEFLGRGPLDLKRRDVVKVPEGLSEKVLVPLREVGVARERRHPGEREGHVLVIEMAQIEAGSGRVLEMGEPFVDK